MTRVSIVTDHGRPLAVPSTRPFMLVARAWGVSLLQSIRTYRESRRLLAVDDHVLKDIGVSRGNIDWVVCNGRDGQKGS